MSASISVLSTDTVDSSACIVVLTENKRIIFDVGEGTQRLCVEHSVRLGKVSDIFITGCAPKYIGGLPVADSGKDVIHVHGPDGIEQFMRSTRHFMGVPDSRLQVSSDCRLADSVYQCDTITVHALRFSVRGSSRSSHVCYVGQTAVGSGKFDVARAAAAGVPKGPLFGKLKSGQSVCLPDGRVVEPEHVLGPSEPSRYFAVVCDVSGWEEALVGAVRSHTLMRRFVSGGDLFGSLDCMIHLSPADITRSDRYQSWLRELAGADSAVCHIAAGTQVACAQTAFLAATKYCNKLHRVAPELFPHLRLTSGRSDRAEVESSLKGSAFPNDAQSVQLLPARPQLRFDLLPSRVRGLTAAPTVESLIEGLEADVEEFWADAQQPGTEEAGSIVKDLRVARDIQAAAPEETAVEELVVRCQLTVAQSMTLGSGVENLADSQHAAEVLRLVTSLGLQGVRGATELRASAASRLVFLGTGCAVPSKYRNVSGILLQIAGTGSSMLLDAGEGTWRQLLRLEANSDAAFRPTSLDNSEVAHSSQMELARQLKAVWISHPHADHHLGLLTVLLERRRLLIEGGLSESFEPMLVIAPASILLYLAENEALFPDLAGAYMALSNRQLDPSDSCELTDSYWASLDATFDKRPPVDSSWQQHQQRHRAPVSEHCRAHLADRLSAAWAVLSKMGVRNLSNVQVTHCSQSYGLILETTAPSATDRPFKLVYSGDTRPCERLVAAGQGATVLIHEATFEDGKLEEARTKRHSTIGEALDAGDSMGAFRVILTHFSQRYPTMPQIDSPVPQPAVIEPMQAFYQRRKSSARSGVRNSLNYLVAFDFMAVHLGELLWAPTLVPALERAFPSAGGDDDEAEQGNGEISEARVVVSGSSRTGSANNSKSFVKPQQQSQQVWRDDAGADMSFTGAFAHQRCMCNVPVSNEGDDNGKSRQFAGHNSQCLLEVTGVDRKRRKKAKE